MRLEKLINAMCEALSEEIEQMLAEDKDSSYATIDTNDGYLDVRYDNNTGKVEVIVYHDNSEDECCCENLETYLEEAIEREIDIDAIVEKLEEDAYMDDIWHRNGFDSAADFWHYKFG